MKGEAALEKTRAEGWTDEELVQRILSGETALYEIIMRRYNQRLYRVARAILRNDGEAEDVAEDAYVRAYEHLNQFAGRASFSTWLTRIALHEAYARRKRSMRTESFEQWEDGKAMNIPSRELTPEQQAANSELCNLLEQAILGLPEGYRVVVMLRDVEQLSTSETAAALDLSEENVKVRLHRGHLLLREQLYASVGSVKESAFTILGARCDRIVQHVFERLQDRSTR